MDSPCQIIRTNDDIGDSVHTSPTIKKVNESTIDEYLLTSIWTGRVSCIQLDMPSFSTTHHSASINMKRKWYTDL